MRLPVSVRTSFCARASPASKASRSVWPSTVECIEDLPRAQAQDGALLDAQKAPRRLGDQHRPPVPGEEQNSVLQIAENLVQVLLQCGKNLFHIAHALADHLDLVGDARRRVLPRSRFSPRRPSRWSGPVVKLVADLFQRPQGQIARAGKPPAARSPAQSTSA